MAEEALDDTVDTGADDTAVSNDTGGAGEEKASAASLMSDDGDGKEIASPSDWPEDWRDRLSGGDEKVAKRLSRFSSPQTILKSLFEAERKISSGQLRKTLGPDATEEEIAAYRKEMGLPEKAEDYPLNFEDGFTPAEEDKELLNSFKEIALQNNTDPATASKFAQWALSKGAEIRAAEEGARVEADKQALIEGRDQLIAEYGPEFRSNMAINKNFMTAVYGDLADDLMEARLPDGTKFGNNPELIRRMVDYAREVMPGADLMPGGSGDPAKGIDAELDAIAEKRRTDYAGYMADEKLQARELKLIEAKQRRGQKAA